MQLITAAACRMLGRDDEARDAVESLRKHNPGFVDLQVVREDLEKWNWVENEMEEFLKGLEKLG